MDLFLDARDELARMFDAHSMAFLVCNYERWVVAFWRYLSNYRDYKGILASSSEHLLTLFLFVFLKIF
jgi:hypothetical protein